jgi:uncharacterized membrane protein YccF (DUF307 family)
MLSTTSRFRSHLSGIGSRSFGTVCAPRAEELQPLNIVKPNEDRRRRSIIECLASRTSDAIEPRLPLKVLLVKGARSFSRLSDNFMSPTSFLLNLLWIVFGGLWMAIGWVIAGVIMAITIIGLPWTRAAFNIAAYTLLPFGQKAVSRAEYTGRQDIGTGSLGVLGNILWLVLAGWWLALAHVVTAILLAITIIGIPFAWAHLKLAGLALWPIGKMIVPA